MNEFTYEYKTPKSCLETYEWDNLWWEKANDNENKDRVLIIGDSISCSYRNRVNEILGGRVYADGLGTSKSIDNPMLMQLIDYVIMQSKECKVIQFNNGLHGWHISNEDYFEYYIKVIRSLKEKFADKKFIIALTTPVRQKGSMELLDERNEMVIARNIVASEIAIREGFIVNDFYSAVIEHPEYYYDDGVHLIPEACEILAQMTADAFLKALAMK